MNRDRSSAAACVLALAPIAAFGAELVVRTLDGSARFWWTFGIVQVLALAGYAGASLKEWAGWRDGTRAQRLAIVQGLIVSLLAANITYYGGFYGLPAIEINIVEIGCFIAATLAAFGGTRTLDMMRDSLLTLLQTFINRARPGASTNGDPK